MTLRLTIDEAGWRAHVDQVRRRAGDILPVVKGNGYGLGRVHLAGEAATFGGEVAVGTVHEAAGLEHLGLDAIVVLTPALSFGVALPPNAVPTVGNLAHADALRAHGWTGRVAIKLASSMRRYGTDVHGLAELATTIGAARWPLHSYVFHPPLPAADDRSVRAEIEAWLPALDAGVPLSVSHVDAPTIDALRHDHPDRRWPLRAGTALWHGDKSHLRLGADVLEVRAVHGGEAAGYRRAPVPTDGHLVMIGAGTAHGVTPLVDGRSPFHFARRRLALHEAPHMHSSMVFVADGDPCPAVGDWVDVQRPLTSVAADELCWR